MLGAADSPDVGANLAKIRFLIWGYLQWPFALAVISQVAGNECGKLLHNPFMELRFVCLDKHQGFYL